MSKSAKVVLAEQLRAARGKAFDGDSHVLLMAIYKD